MNLWSLSLDDYIQIMEEAIILGRERGKKEGENLEVEFFEVAKKRGIEIKHIAQTDMDKDLLIGNMREELKCKILDMTKKENENQC
jgi:hypothetical protein